MRKVVVDTSVYVDFFRRGGENPLKRILSDFSYAIYLSSVVAQELFAGAQDEKDVGEIERFFGSFERSGRVLTPSKSDWLECGRVLSQIGRKHGFESVKKGRLVNDILIALSCHDVEAAILTLNLKDFQMIGEFIEIEIL